MTRFGLHGCIRAHPGEGEALVDRLLEAAEVLGQDLQCELYVVGRDAEDADAVWVTEIWSSRAAHEASLTVEAVREVITRTRPLIAGMGERIETEPIGGKGLDTPADLRP